MKYDQDFARMIAWLRENALEAHTDRNGKTVFIKRRAKKRRVDIPDKPSHPAGESEGSG